MGRKFSPWKVKPPEPVGIPSKLPDDTPPAFMLIAADDNHTSVLLNLMQRFREIGVDYEAHIYARGGHGFGMGARSERLSIQKWPERMLDWLYDEVVDQIPKQRTTKEKRHPKTGCRLEMKALVRQSP